MYNIFSRATVLQYRFSTDYLTYAESLKRKSMQQQFVEEIARGVAREVTGPSPVLCHAYSNGGKANLGVCFMYSICYKIFTVFYEFTNVFTQDACLSHVFCNRFTGMVRLLSRKMMLWRWDCFICNSIWQASFSTAGLFQ